MLKLHPPHNTDQPIIARLKRIGIEPGKSLDVAKLDAVVQKANRRCPGGRAEADGVENPDHGARCEQLVDEHRHDGCIRNYYLKRAIVTQVGLGANLPEDAVYPLNLGDETGKPLDGANKYAIHFAKDETPPADAFWSITLYDPEGFQVAESAQPLCGEQLDAFQARRRRIADALLPE